MTTTQKTAIVPAGYFPASQPLRRPLGNGPLLQWFNALPAGKALATGWHIQANRCSEELAAALKAYGYPRVSVLHRMSGEIVEYWAIETCSLFVLCNGFEDSWTMKESSERQGIAYGWIEAKNHSKIKSRVIIAELAAVGYFEPFTISLEGMITEEYLAALEQQFRVLDAFEHLSGNPAPFYGFSLTLAPAEKAKMVGNNGKQSPIVPMTTDVPAQIDEDYLRNHLCPAELLAAIQERDLIGKAIMWSVETSKIIARGDDKETWETSEYSAATGFDEEEDLEPEQPAKEVKWTPATKQQTASIAKLCGHLGRQAPAKVLSHEEAGAMLKTLSAEYNNNRKK